MRAPSPHCNDDGVGGIQPSSCATSALSRVVQPRHLGPAAPSGLPLVADDFLLACVAARVDSVLSSCPVRPPSIDDSDLAVRSIDVDGPGWFDLDRWWLDEVVTALTSADFLHWLAHRLVVEPGNGIDLGAHALETPGAVSWHDDRRRGQRLGVVWFASHPPPTGGALLVASPRGIVRISPVANRLAVFDAREPHAVGRVTKGVRRTLVGRTWLR